MTTPNDNDSAAATTTAGPRIYTWVSRDGAVVEQARMTVRGERTRARGHIIAVGTDARPAYTLTYDVEVDTDGQIRRVGLESVSVDAEIAANLRRDGNGEWLLEDNTGGRHRIPEGDVRDVHVPESMLFYSLALRARGLHRQQTEEDVTALNINPVTLEVKTVSAACRSDDSMVYLVTDTAATAAHVDADGMIVDVPGSVERR